MALGPFAIGRGHRDLVSVPSAIVMEDAITILSSGSFNNQDMLGFGSIIKSFQPTVWFSICLSILLTILTSALIDYIKAKNLNNNLQFFIESIINYYFVCHGNLLQQR